MASGQTYPELCEEKLRLLPEEAPLAREEVRIMWKWFDRLTNLLELQGFAWRGESFKNQGWATLLVMKVALDGAPLVAFVTGRNTTDCARIFLRQLEDRTVEWKPDKF